MREKKTWFSSDWHLGHTNVIRFDKRPFKSVEEMNEAIIKNAMSQLKEGDDFYFIGDFAFATSAETERWLATLASSGANLYFIKGNHDKKDTIKLYNKYGTYLGEQKKIKVGEQEIVLNHYAMRVWDKSHHGVWHLYGHSHCSLPDLSNSLSFDVGCMGHNYLLWEMEEVRERMSKKTFKAIDHHGKN